MDFGFSLSGFETGPNRFSIKFSIKSFKSSNSSFLSKMWTCYQEMQPNFKIWAIIFLKCPAASKLESIRTKIFLQEVDQQFCEWNSICQILVLTLWPVTPPCFLPKKAQLVQNVIAFFPEKGEEIEHWFWYLWIVQWLSDRNAGRGAQGGGGWVGGVKGGPKVQILGPSCFNKNSNPSKIFEAMFLFARIPPLAIISA